MLSVKEIAERLQDRRLDKVAEATGLHRNTIMKYRDGEVEQPYLDTVQKLSDYLTGALAKDQKEG